ncbi:MAG: tetratricopeptide repeat protein [Myxococcales bacterium]
MGLGLAGLLATGGGGCATASRPVSKIVNGHVITTRPVSPEAYGHVARAFLYEEEQRWDEAARELQRALPFDDEAAEVRAHLAELFVRLGRLDDAAEQVQRSLQIADSVDGRLSAAHVAEARHDEKTALAHYQAAARLALSDEDSAAVERTHLDLADAQLGALDLAGAHESIRTLRDASPDSVRARVELAALAWALGRMPEAEAALVEALRLEPAELDARLMMAALLVATGRTAEAKSEFREALGRSEDSPDIAEMYLKWLVARGDTGEAAEEAERLTPDVVDEGTFELIVRLQRAAGRLDRVRRTAEEALKKGANPSRVALLVAGALVDAKDRLGAAAELARVPRTSPDFIESRLRLAEALREVPGGTELERAGRALDEASAAVTAQADGAAKRPAPADRGGRPEGHADTTLEREGTTPRDWTTELVVARALWEEKRGDAVRAARTIDAVLKGEGGRWNGVKTSRAVASDIAAKNGSTGATDSNSSPLPSGPTPPSLPGSAQLNQSPGPSRLLLVRGAIEERRGEWRRALVYAEKVLAADPRHIEALNFHGFISVDHDFNLPVALKRLQAAMALDPGAGGIVDSVGWAHLRAGDLARATEFLTEADRLEPGDPEIQSHLGELLARKQDVPRAIAMYKQALSNEPPERLAREINARLRALEAKSAAGR